MKAKHARRPAHSIWTTVLLTCLAGEAAARGPLPIGFEANRGQTDSAVQFLARGSGYTLFLTSGETVMVLGSSAGDTGSSIDLRMKLVGADPSAVATGLDPLPGVASYFVGNDPSQWRRSVPTFARVRLASVYPGIDLVHYGNEGRLEYDFVVAPGSDAAAIRFDLLGADAVAIASDGDLLVSAGGREVRWQRPVCYQEIDGLRREVEGRYEQVAPNRFGFRVGDHDRDRPLVIDPVLVYATYVAPTGFAAGDGLSNIGLAIAADADGNAYVAGLTESASFPTTVGAFRTTRPGKRDVFVAKLNPAATALVYSTYLGGSENEIQNAESLGIAVDDDGNVYLAGATASANFPTTAGAYQETNNGTHDAFVTKLDSSGSNLVYSTYLGGTGIDYGWDIAVNAAGEAHVCGETNGNFPTTPGAYQSTPNGGSGFVAKVSADGSALVYSTLVGHFTGKARSIALDKSGNAFITGIADTPHGATFWPTTDGAFQTVGKGTFDAFVTKLNAAGSGLVWSTYLGGSANEDGRSVALDAAGNVFVAGNTNSTDFPAAEGAFQTTFQSTPTPQDDGFVVELKADGSDTIHATYLGASQAEGATALVVDGAGSAIVTGHSWSTDFPTTDDAFQATFTPASAAFSATVAKLEPDASDLAFSTYLHPTNQGVSSGYAIALDGVGGVYVTGVSAAMFPTTAGVFQSSTFNPGFGGPLVVKLDIATPTPTTVCGDFNGDGKVTAADALAVLRDAVGDKTCALSTCDYNGDGRITAADALAVLRVAVGQSVEAKCP